MDLSLEAVRTKISLDIEVRQIGQKWKYKSDGVYDGEPPIVGRELTTHEVRQEEYIYGTLCTRVEENVHRGPPGNFTSDFHLWSILLAGWPLRWRGCRSSQRPGETASTAATRE